ncbi:type IV toxin-antitoxin system AbiEi family antitoxin [Curvibacter sp. AEP1-3]|uniref:type IV toxin-antitoxin system AbiEi family antitoxin n=1 Tax=Curvibacter sp. AEP1-3 TaxID=1844971 RepID=UPI0012FC6C88|nr:type IV toxin-antitoxin system AbiEi family antitoxin [Curvibacter sp. AEP1-3]
MKSIQTESRLLEGLLSQFTLQVGGIPGSRAELHQVEYTEVGHPFDAMLQVVVAGSPLKLFIEARTRVFPKDAHDHVRRWQGYSSSAPEAGRPGGLVLAAQTISPGAREILVNNGIGYFAEGGSLCLPFQPIFIHIDKPSKPHATTGGREFNLFTEARLTVMQAMLRKRTTPYTVMDLASITGTSTATISKLMTQLELLEWVETEGSGPNKRRKLANPGAVLDAWVSEETARLPHRKERRFFLKGRKAADIPLIVADALASAEEPAATSFQFTGEAAAQIHAPFLTSWAVASMRVAPALVSRLLTELQAVEVDSGYNLLIIEEGLSALRLSEAHGNVPYASPEQTYVDLMCGNGRAPDAARFLREQELKF